MRESTRFCTRCHALMLTSILLGAMATPCGTAWIQSGPDTIRTCEDDPNGLTNATVRQPLDDSFSTAYTSDDEFPFAVADSFDPLQLPVPGDIDEMRWWGFSVQYDDEVGAFVATCLEDDETPFDITGFADDGVPGNFDFGPPIDVRQNVTPVSIVDSGVIFAFATMWEYTAHIVPPLGPGSEIEWIGVVRQQGQSVPEPGGSDPCLFLWTNNGSGLYGLEARQSGAAVPELTFDFIWCIGTVEPCPWDCEPAPNGSVGTADLLVLLAHWGGAGSCDFDGGGAGTSDLLKLLANWGECP